MSKLEYYYLIGKRCCRLSNIAALLLFAVGALSVNSADAQDKLNLTRMGYGQMLSELRSKVQVFNFFKPWLADEEIKTDHKVDDFFIPLWSPGTAHLKIEHAEATASISQTGIAGLHTGESIEGTVEFLMTTYHSVHAEAKFPGSAGSFNNSDSVDNEAYKIGSAPSDDTAVTLTGKIILTADGTYEQTVPEQSVFFDKPLLRAWVGDVRISVYHLGDKRFFLYGITHNDEEDEKSGHVVRREVIFRIVDGLVNYEIPFSLGVRMDDTVIVGLEDLSVTRLGNTELISADDPPPPGRFPTRDEWKFETRVFFSAEDKK